MSEQLTTPATFAKVPDVAAPVAVTPHRLVNLFTVRSNQSTGRGRRIHWVRIAGTALLGLATLHMLIAAAVLAFVRYERGVSGVSYLDLLVPRRWPNYRTALGEHQISLAKKSVSQGRCHEAVIWARTGLAHAPANRDGRLLLARLYLEGDQPDNARRILLNGLQFHRDDPRFLLPLFRTLLHQQQDAVTIALAGSLLAAPSPNPECNRLAALAAATVCFLRGDFDQAENLLHHSPSLAGSRDARLVATRIDHARGYRDLALVSLRALTTEFPHDFEIQRELIQRLREAGRRNEARQYSLSFQIAHPTLAPPRIDLLRDLLDSGEPMHVAREVDALIRDFATDSDALLALADFAVHAADPKLVRRLLEHARAHALPLKPYALLVVESLVAAHDHRGALEAADTLSKEFPDFARHFGSPLDGLRGIAYYGLGETETGRLLIGHHLSQPWLRAENLLAVAQRLLDVDAPAAARDVLVRAVTVDPLNQAALTRLVELDLNLNRLDELPAHLLRLVTMRQPPPDILRVAQHKLGSDLLLFSADRPAALAAVRTALARTPPIRSRF